MRRSLRRTFFRPSTSSSLGPQSPRVFSFTLWKSKWPLSDPSVLGFIFLRVIWSKRQGLVTKGKNVFNTLYGYIQLWKSKIAASYSDENTHRWSQVLLLSSSMWGHQVHQILITTDPNLVSQIQYLSAVFNFFTFPSLLRCFVSEGFNKL